MTINYYNQHADKYFESTVCVDMSNIYQRFLPLIRPGSIIIDAGCGSGRDALYFKSHGFNVAAFDSSIEMSKKAQEFLNQRVEVTTFDLFSMPFLASGIWCCASLLHVPRKDLVHSLTNMDEHLLPGGVMYVNFKYGDLERVENGRGFTDMTENSLAKLIAKLPSLTVSETWITTDNRPERANEKWLNALLIKSENEY